MILGLVAAKKKSNRFPGKNKTLYKGKPLFWYSVEPLLQSKKIDDIYVVTDSNYIKAYCIKRDIGVIWRSKNASKNEDKLINILRYAYYTLDIEYDIVVSIMANCPGHNSSDVDKGIELLKNNNLREVRSFNDGSESGLLIMDNCIITNNNDISYYIGNIQTNAKEIHFKSDL